LLLVRLRMAEDVLPLEDAIRAVLKDNVFGLELDARCTQIAAFSLALTAWRMPGEVVALPELNIACSGIAPSAVLGEWLKLAEQSGMPRSGHERELAEMALVQLHELFSQAPVLGSLINPKDFASGKIAADYETIRPYLNAIMNTDQVDDSTRERASAAASMARAADLLGGQYMLTTSNRPRPKGVVDYREYLGSGYGGGSY